VSLEARVRELGLHPDGFVVAPVAMLDRRALKAATAKLERSEGWHIRERALVCTLVTTAEGQDVLIGVIPWKPSSDDPPITRESLYSLEARERHEQRFLAAASHVLLQYPSALEKSVLFCVAGLASGAQERALVELGVHATDARELIELWDETGDA
jgi:hypothetical protein